MSGRSRTAVIARWLRALAAVVAGNAFYFVVLAPRLPQAWRHRPFTLDLGLGLDFALCLALYLALERLARPRRPA